MEFPRLVFTSPGPHACNGGTYGHEIVKDAKEYAVALDAGFFPSLPEALDAAKAEKAPKVAPKEPAPKEAASKDTAPKEPETPKEDVRGDLMKRAQELGIDVDDRWGVKRLREEIAFAESEL